jgi:hypothetical protein
MPLVQFQKGAPMTPAARTLKYLRERGYHAAVVERWNAFARLRQDLFGIFDVLAFVKKEKPFRSTGVLAVQTTSGANLANRLAKVIATSLARDWLLAGNRCEIHGWSKRGPRGKRKLWSVNVRPVTLADFRNGKFIPPKPKRTLFSMPAAPKPKPPIPKSKTK